MSLPPNKFDLRTAALTRRKSISDAELDAAGDRLASFADEMLQGCSPHATVAAYVSMGTEIPTLGLIGALRERGCTVIVPRLGTGLEVGWSTMNDPDALAQMPRTRSGGMRPREPTEAAQGPELLGLADLIVLPALAVDRWGTRLGRGGGWYDRALLHRRRPVRRLAVCWPWEISETRLPREPHDIAVDGVVSTVGLRWLTA